jgi:hypothetical protein
MEVIGQLHAPPLYPQEKIPWYPLDRRLGGPQSRSGGGGEEKNSQPLLGLSFSKVDSSGFFLLEAYKIHSLSEKKKCKMSVECVTESSELQSVLPMKWLPVPVQKLNIVLVCRTTAGAHIEIY